MLERRRCTHAALKGAEVEAAIRVGARLWPAARLLSTWIEEHPTTVRNATVLELGCGAGLPSLVAVLAGARRVVATDFPDAPMIANVQLNLNTHLAHLSVRVCPLFCTLCLPLSHTPQNSNVPRFSSHTKLGDNVSGSTSGSACWTVIKICLVG